MSAVKIAVIGAGSAVFSLGLVRDLCLQDSLAGSTVAFMDINAHRLRMIHRLAERYAAEIGANLRFEATSNRDVALRDAHFVLNTVQPLGHDAEEAWRMVAEQHGYYRGLRYSDSARSLQTNLHQYTFMVGLARDIELLSPGAWLIDSANPVFEGCTLMTRETGVKVIGLCHGFHGYRRVAQFLGVAPEEIDQVEWEAPGVNHWIYLTQFRHRGQDLYRRLDEWIETEAAPYWASFKGPYSEFHLARAVVDHYQRVGLLAIGDAARTFDQWYYHADLETKQRWYGHLGGRDSEISWGQYLERLDGNIRRIEQVATDESVPVTTLVKPRRTREVQVPIIDAIANDRPGIFQVNVPNNGAIQGIADDVVVEGKALVDASGAKLVQVGTLPQKLMQMVLQPRIAAAEKGLLAYRTGDRDLLVSAVLDDHRTHSLDQAEAVVTWSSCSTCGSRILHPLPRSGRSGGDCPARATLERPARRTLRSGSHLTARICTGFRAVDFRSGCDRRHSRRRS